LHPMSVFRKFWATSLLTVIVLFIGPAFLSACATARTLIPLEDGASVNIEQRSATRTVDNAVVTVTASASKGRPPWLGEVVTPVYAVVENRGASPIEFDYRDLVIFDERHAQYPALAPEAVADRIRSVGHYYAPPPPPPPLFRGRPFWPWWSDPWAYGPSWSWYDPWASDRYSYARPNVSDIYAEALLVGRIRPRARAQGFIYFPRLPAEVQRVTISIGYKRSGETISREAVFPFLLHGEVGPQ
ncbi:MAG: hypothetical protein WAP47_10280, partial [Candidatus Rokuibacteriota bacterium]